MSDHRETASGGATPRSGGGASTPPFVDVGMIRKIARQDLAVRRVELLAAIADDDWPRAAKVAHYLATTADLLEDARLRAACVACVEAVRAGDTPSALAAAGLIAPGPVSR